MPGTVFVQLNRADAFITSPCSTARYLVFSAARPGQEGVGHISPRTREAWQRIFEGAGLQYMPELTRLVQRLCDARNVNHRLNIMVGRAEGWWRH